MLWSPERETKESVENRATSFLDKVFANGREDTCMSTSISLFVIGDHLALFIDISATAHSGWINALLRVIGQGNYPLPTGGTYQNSVLSTQSC